MKHVHLVLAIAAVASPAFSTGFFVDSKNGSDSKDGLSAANAWKSLGPVNSHTFKPGDAVNFLAGSQFSELLTIDNSGTRDSPITFKASGTGDKPLFSRQGIRITGNWIIVEGLHVKDVANNGMNISSAATHNIVRGCEISACGSGMGVNGPDNLITKNHIHDLLMIKNTTSPDDDYGAVGIWMTASRIEISYNVFERCKSQCYDYKFDGGAVEWYASGITLSDCYVHHNFAAGCEGFMESGGKGGKVVNSRVAYNVSVNSAWFALLNSTGQYAITLDNFQIDNNTVINTVPHDGWGANQCILFFVKTAMAVHLRNNVFYLDGWGAVDNPNLTRRNNLYCCKNGSVGFALNSTERSGDPLFVDSAGGNYDLQAGSPAVDLGAPLGYTLDFKDRLVPYGAAPDAGAFENHGNSAVINVFGGWKGEPLIGFPNPTRPDRRLLFDGAMNEEISGGELTVFDLFGKKAGSGNANHSGMRLLRMGKGTRKLAIVR